MKQNQNTIPHKVGDYWVPGTKAEFYQTREEARYAVVKGYRQYDAGNKSKKGKRWFTDVAV